MTELTVKELAVLERVTERTVWNWIAKGAVEVRRTYGSGVRIIERRSVTRSGGVVFFSINDPKSTETTGNPST